MQNAKLTVYYHTNKWQTMDISFAWYTHKQIFPLEGSMTPFLKRQQLVNSPWMQRGEKFLLVKVQAKPNIYLSWTGSEHFGQKSLASITWHHTETLPVFMSRLSTILISKTAQVTSFILVLEK